MSGRISITFVDFSAFSFEFDRVRCVSFRPFLVRNWCGVRPVPAAFDAMSSFLELGAGAVASDIGTDPVNREVPSIWRISAPLSR